MGHYLLFTVASNHFAMDIEAIELVIQSFKPNPSPATKEGLLGLVAINQKLLPVITPTAKLNRPFKEIELQDKVIFCKEGGMLVNKLIDVVSTQSFITIPHETALPFCKNAIVVNKVHYGILEADILFREVLQ